MTDQQRARFNAEYGGRNKDEVVGVLLAFFLGVFGIHQFYLDRKGLGILYLCLSVTGISAILGFIDCFFMPGRVRQYNSALAGYIAAQVHSQLPNAPAALNQSPARPCPGCGQPLVAGATYCSRCGSPSTAAVA